MSIALIVALASLLCAVCCIWMLVGLYALRLHHGWTLGEKTLTAWVYHMTMWPLALRTCARGQYDPYGVARWHLCVIPCQLKSYQEAFAEQLKRDKRASGSRQP